MNTRQIAVIVSGFPRRSETFALHELLALEARGLLAQIFATKRGDEDRPQPGVERLLDRVTVLRPASPSSQALEVAQRLMGRRVGGIHAYFAHAPAAVAQLAARILKLPFGFSMHARDARKVPKGVLHQRARDSACVVACNEDVAREMEGSGATVRFVPHGVDLDRFRPMPNPQNTVPRILAVGRLVEKKGFDVLLDAVAHIKTAFELRVVGDGPLRGMLEEKKASLGLDHVVTFCGNLTHETLATEYAAAEIVVVPSIVDQSGDRDGLPNVVLEAMACGRPVVATRTGAIASAINSSTVGELVAAGDADELSRAVVHLLRDVRRRDAIGFCARVRVEHLYNLDNTTHRFCDVIEGAYV